MLLLTFPCSLDGTMNCSDRSMSLAGPTLLLFLQRAQGNLGWYGPGLGLRSAVCITFKMAMHVGCFWCRNAILYQLLDFQPAVVFVDGGKYLYSKSGDINKAVIVKLSLRFP